MNATTLTFWALAGVLVAVCLGIILLPLARARRRVYRDSPRREANIEIYRQRRAEIRNEAADGRLTTAQAREAETELGRRLLHDVDAEGDESDRAAHRRPRPWLGALIGVALVAGGSVTAYVALGDPQAIGLGQMPNLAQMTSKLESRVQSDPDDWRARVMLARLQQNAGDYKSAVSNLAFLNRQFPNDDPELLKAEAESRLAAGEHLSGRAGQLFTRVLEYQPHDAEALWYVGLQAAEAGHRQRALKYWNRLLAQKLPDDLRAKVVSRRNALMGDRPSL